MSDVQTQLNNWERDLRSKLEDLRDSLRNRWVRWSEWEREFIHNVTFKLNSPKIDVTTKQYERIVALWERI